MDRKYLIGGVVGAGLMMALACSPISPFRASSARVYSSPDEPSVLVARKLGADQVMIEHGTGAFIDKRVYTSPSWIPDPVKRAERNRKLEEEIEIIVPKRHGMFYNFFNRIFQGANYIKG